MLNIFGWKFIAFKVLLERFMRENVLDDNEYLTNVTKLVIYYYVAYKR